MTRWCREPSSRVSGCRALSSVYGPTSTITPSRWKTAASSTRCVVSGGSLFWSRYRPRISDSDVTAAAGSARGTSEYLPSSAGYAGAIRFGGGSEGAAEAPFDALGVRAHARAEDGVDEVRR